MRIYRVVELVFGGGKVRYVIQYKRNFSLFGLFRHEWWENALQYQDGCLIGPLSFPCLDKAVGMVNAFRDKEVASAREVWRSK